MIFHVVDAFSKDLFGGNPAGVGLIEDGLDFPSDDTMLKVAAEVRYSETVFVKPIGNQQFQMRYFTPAAEVDLCGHATIAAVHSLIREKLVDPESTVLVKTLAGDINLCFDQGKIFMDMATPEKLMEISDSSSVKNIYDILGLKNVPELKYVHMTMTPMIVSTGLPDIILPIPTAAILDEIQPNFAALSQLSRDYDVVGLHAFSINPTDSSIHCRNFAPLYGINEEAATGTANGALTYYLYLHDLIKEQSINDIIQGESMGRPSNISTKLTECDGKIKIQVGGSAATLLTGNLYI